MQAIAGGNNRYPSLQSICQLFRVKINDTMSGATGTPGEGQVMPNTNPDLLEILNSGCRDIFSDLRNVGDPALVLDNYILTGIPPLTAPNPALRVTLSYTGYNNGFTWSNAWMLPISCQRVLGFWERQSGINATFVPMQQVQWLPSGYQTQRMGVWAMEQNAVVMPGSLQMVDLRLRCLITYPDNFNAATLDFKHTYVPILDCQNAVAAKMKTIYTERFAPDQYQMSFDIENRLVDKLKLEVVRQRQSIQNTRAEFGAEATGSFTDWYWQL